MKTRTSIFLLLSIVITACGGVTPILITETPTPRVATQTSTPYLTNTPIATPYNWWENPTPETIFGYPTPSMPIETDPVFPDIPVKQKRLSTNELYIGNYVLRNWCKEIEVIQAYCAITISSLEKEQVEIWGFPAYLGAETGTDLTGRGYPDIVIISAQGNPSSEIIVYEAGKSLRKIMDIRSRHSVRFVDLNNDKSYEALADVRIWSQFSDCSPIIIPLVYEYNAESGYTDKTSKYREILLSDIQWGVDSLTSYKLENPNTEVPLCRVYHLVTAYLVTGQQEKAWSILDENYSPEKAAEYKAGFLSDLGSLIP